MNKYTGWRKEFAPQNQTTVNSLLRLYGKFTMRDLSLSIAGSRIVGLALLSYKRKHFLIGDHISKRDLA